MGFSENLRKLRIEKGLSQKKLADMAGVSQTAIYNWERGARNPKIEQVEKIAIALNVHFEDLLPFDNSLKSLILKTDNSETTPIPMPTMEDVYTYGGTVIEEIDRLQKKRSAGEPLTNNETQTLTELYEWQRLSATQLRNNLEQSGEYKVITVMNSLETEFRDFLNKKYKHDDTLTEKKYQTLNDFPNHIQEKFNRLNKSIERIKEKYSLLNDKGQKQANEQIENAIDHAADQVELLTKIPEYQKEPPEPPQK